MPRHSDKPISPVPEESQPKTTEAKIEALYQEMQKPGFGKAMYEAFHTTPRVIIDFSVKKDSE
jgi:hypothetical protein